MLRGAFLPLAAFSVSTVLCGIAAYFTVFSGFAQYDDEGYILLSLKGFVGGHALYDQVYSQYGPAFYEIWGGLFGLTGRPVTHEAGRLIVVAVTLVSSGLLGWSAFRMTRSIVLGLCVQLLSTVVLAALSAEPMHPGGLLCLLLAALVAVAVLAFPKQPRVALAAMGALIGTALLVKINVGGLALVSTVFAGAVALGPARRDRVLRAVAVVAFVVAPVVLMARDLDQAWAARYAWSAVTGALALALVALPVRSSGPAAPRAWPAWLAAGAGCAVIGEMLIAVLLGTSPGSLVHAVLVAPLGQRDAFALPLRLAGVAPVLGLAAVAAAGWQRRRVAVAGRLPPVVGGAARLAAGLAIWFSIAPERGRDPHHADALAVGLALAWVAALPPRGERRSGPVQFARVLIPALAVLQALHAYPVAGSQVSFACLLFVPVGAICVADGLSAISAAAATASVSRVPVVRRMTVAVLSAVLVGSVALVGRQADRAFSAWSDGATPSAATAQGIRLAHPAAALYTRLAASIDSRCSTFLTYPGMDSLYLFARRDPPTWSNATDWMWLFDSALQRRIVDQVRVDPGLCLVKNASLIDFWANGRQIPQRPLVQFIETSFRPVERLGGYELMIRTGKGS